MPKYGYDIQFSGDPYLDLANAIVADAAKEYRALRKRLYKQYPRMHPSQIKAIRHRMQEIEDFFTKQMLGDILTRGLGPVILEKLKNERI